MLKVMPSANKVLPSFKAEVTQNTTQPIQLKPFLPGENITQVEGPMSKVAHCMMRMEK
jgi:hypothetical protein